MSAPKNFRTYELNLSGRLAVGQTVLATVIRSGINFWHIPQASRSA